MLLEYMRDHSAPSEVQDLATAMLTGPKTLNAVYYGHARQRDAYDKVSFSPCELHKTEKKRLRCAPSFLARLRMRRRKGTEMAMEVRGKAPINFHASSMPWMLRSIVPDGIQPPLCGKKASTLHGFATFL